MTDTPDFWQEHKQRLQHFIRKRVADPHSADDILQDVLLKAHSRIHSLNNPASVSAWLFRIATNTITDYYRSHRKTEALPEDLSNPEVEASALAELAECIQPLITQMPETYRQALELTELQGLPQKQVAQQLGLSLSGAKSRIQRGRDKLRHEILECCELETAGGRVIDFHPRKDFCKSPCK